jgi:hypothetical protein
MKKFSVSPSQWFWLATLLIVGVIEITDPQILNRTSSALTEHQISEASILGWLSIGVAVCASIVIFLISMKKQKNKHPC